MVVVWTWLNHYQLPSVAAVKPWLSAKKHQNIRSEKVQTGTLKILLVANTFPSSSPTPYTTNKFKQNASFQISGKHSTS